MAPVVIFLWQAPSKQSLLILAFLTNQIRISNQSLSYGEKKSPFSHFYEVSKGLFPDCFVTCLQTYPFPCPETNE